VTFAQPFKDYEILDRIGSGAMGTVFKARHKSLDRIVALKVLRPSLARDQRYVARLSREARIVAAFNHPNIVAGYDLGQEGGYHFFVMELVEGKSLRELLSEWGSFPEAQVLDTAIKVTSALDHAYKKGVIHRDIKPGNILVDAHNRVKLTDMGLAKGPADLTITREGATVGTPQYISPEQARDPQNVDVRTDLYSLGATLFHMCTGQPPFRAETIANVILKVINDRAPSARDVNPEVSEQLSLVIRKLMAKDPDLRYQTPAELLKDLHKVQRDEQPDVNLRQLEALDHVGSKPSRWALVAGGLAGLLALVAIGTMLFGGNGNSKQPEIHDPRPEADYRRDLRKDLAQEEWPARFKALRNREAVANPRQQEILAKARAELERDLDSELNGFLARQDERLRQWILNWGTGKRFFEMDLPDRMSERFGLRPSELADGLRSSYDQQVERLEAKVLANESERDTAYLTRLDNSHKNLYATSPEYRERLQGHDFYGAERTLRQTLQGFHRDGPPRAEMPPQLQLEVEKRETSVLTRELERIAAAEQRIAQKLRSRVDGVVEEVHELLRADPTRPAATTPNPREAKRRLADARKRLIAGFPPEYFHSESSPWPTVEVKLDATEREVKLASTKYERELLRLALRDAYRIAFVDGRAGDAAAYLEGRVFGVGEQELKQHIELLQQAEKMHNKMLTRLLDRQRLRLKVERLPGRTEIAVVLRKQPDGRLVMKHRKEAISLAAVSLPPLEQLAGGDNFRAQLTTDERAGLAVWYLLGGDYAAVSKLTEKGLRSEFLNRDLKPLAEQLRKEELGPQMAATRLLETAHSALKEGDWRKALDTITQIHEQHPAFYQSHQAEEERIKHEAKDGLSRSDKLAVLEAAAAPGAKVTMQGWRVSVDYPLAKVDLRLQKGWRRSGHEDGGVSFVQPKPTLASALESVLTMKSLMTADDSDRITVRISLSFPEEGATGNPRLVLLRCLGVGVVLALARDGTVMASGVKVSKLKDPKRLQTQLQPGLRLAADKLNVRIMEPDARHQLKVVVRRRGGRLIGTVYLDEDLSPLIPRFEVSASHPLPELAVIAMHPLTVYAVRFEGEARR